MVWAGLDWGAAALSLSPSPSYISLVEGVLIMGVENKTPPIFNNPRFTCSKVMNDGSIIDFFRNGSKAGK